MQEPYAGVQPITLASYFYYDAEGRLTVSQYPAATSGSPNATTTYTTDHDALGRPSDLYTGTPQQPGWVVNSATYNAAGQLTAMSTGAYNESRQYNTNLQLARLTATPGSGQGIDFTYTYPGTGNNGRISQTTDNITGEQVSYTYDQLNRLVQSVSSVTGTMPFAYDGFGNLTQQGQTTLSIDATTNRINSAGYQYNANGNVTQTPGPTTYGYDVANRLVSNGAIYNPRNQRVFDGTYIYLYTPEGKLAGKYAPAWGAYTSSNAYIQGGQPNVYFAGELIQEQGQWVMTDRLGSVRLKNGTSVERSSYVPYGAEVAPTTSDQRTKFATYYRDSAGLDYAGQRYYSNVTGRFLTPDPGGIRMANPKIPTSWNRYAYTNGDPVNHSDPRGLWSTGDGPGGGGDSGCYEDDDGNIVCVGEEGGGGLCGLGSYFDPVTGDCEPDPGPAPPPQSPPTCADAYGTPSSVEAPQVAVLLGENSWGTYSASVVATEDLYMEQAMYNYAAPKGFATSSGSVDTTINTDTYRGYPHGVGLLTIDLQSPASSSLCGDLTTAEGAYGRFWSGSHSFSDVNRWRAAAAPGPAGTQIAGTTFWNSPTSFYSPTRPVRRPTPPIRLPRPRIPRWPTMPEQD